jgi:hypothetical protein
MMRRGLAEGVLRVMRTTEVQSTLLQSAESTINGASGGGGKRRNLTICRDIDFQITAVSFRAHASSRMTRKRNRRQEKDEENEDWRNLLLTRSKEGIIIVKTEPETRKINIKLVWNVQR